MNRARETLRLTEIERLIPHRGAMQLVREAEIVEPGRTARATRVVTGSDRWVEGHFPGDPILPAIEMIEELAQLAAVMVAHGARMPGHPAPGGTSCGYLAQVDLKFLRPVRPGDTLLLEVRLARQVNHLLQILCSGSVRGIVAVAGRIAVTTQREEPRDA